VEPEVGLARELVIEHAVLEDDADRPARRQRIVDDVVAADQRGAAARAYKGRELVIRK
jgi:hypothetical protein